MINVGIVGGTGYTGGELLRILYMHPEVEITCVTSRTKAGKRVESVHPYLRDLLDLKIQEYNPDHLTDNCDYVFFATPHGVSRFLVPEIHETDVKIVDLSADFRLRDEAVYEKFYGPHPHPELLDEAVYGLPELHREEIRGASLVACPGCMSTASILPLAPLMPKIDDEKIVVDVKIGSSGGGSSFSKATHHPERANVIRPYKVTGHRHTAEIEQELSIISGGEVKVCFSAHAIDAVRGILATIHTFPTEHMEEKDLWRIYREKYRDEPFVRIVRLRNGLYSLPDPKLVIGSNFCDIGFEVDKHVERVVLLSALDNLVKGAAGQAVQNMNIMARIDETAGLKFPGLFPA